VEGGGEDPIMRTGGVDRERGGGPGGVYKKRRKGRHGREDRMSNQSLQHFLTQGKEIFAVGKKGRPRPKYPRGHGKPMLRRSGENKPD